jgi:hypothetical protein
MNSEAIGAGAELLGALGVIITLVYLARQISHNSQQLKGSSEDRNYKPHFSKNG